MFFPDSTQEFEKIYPRSRKMRHTQKEYYMEKIANLYVRGNTIVEISKDLVLNQSFVSICLKEIRKKWLVNQVQNYNELKAKELEKLDALERELWESWNKSKKGINKKTTSKLRRATARGDFDEDLDSNEFTDIPGDPRYLEGVQKCIAQRIKLLGLEEATKIEHSGTLSINAYSMEDRGRLTDEQKMNGIMRFIENLEKEGQEVYEPAFANTEVIEVRSLQEASSRQNPQV